MGAGQQALLGLAAAANYGPDPSSITNLELWLKADSLAVGDSNQISTWVDSSGNGRDATGVIGSALTKPKLRSTLGPNSMPTVEMAITNSTSGPWFTLPNFLTGFSAGHIFAVVQINFDPPSSVNARCGPPFGDFGSAGDEYFPFFSDSKIYDAFGSTVRKTTVNPTPSLTSWRLYESRSASAAWSNHLDGTQLFTTATNTVGWSTTPFIGHSTTSNKVLDGYISEIILYSRVLSGGEITTIKAYITAKYLLTLA